MPFLRTDPLPVVEIRVNGSAPLRCLLDTGGAELIVAADLTGALGLVITGTENGTFGGGRKASLARGRVDSVGLGEFTVHDVPVLTLDLAAIGPAIGEPRIDAILGTSLLSRFRATLDYTGGGLVLERRASPRADVGSPAGAVEMPFWLAGDHYMLAWGAVDDGDSLLCFVDTGLAGIGFACPASTLAGAVTTPGPKARQTGMGGGGRITVAPFVVERLRLGGRARHRVDALAGVFPSSLEWEHGFRIGGLVSHQFFRQGALTLDFDTMTLRVSEPLDAR